MSEKIIERICSVENLFSAWTRFSRGKHSCPDVTAFEHRLEDNLFSLHDKLRSGVYQHDPYTPFTVYDPKQRRIHKATVKDRVVHQVITDVVEPLFDCRFIYDSYSCRVNKGTHAAVARLRTFLRQASENNTRTVYALKCDVRKFFDSVCHRTLHRLLTRRVMDQATLDLLDTIIGSFSVTPHRGLPLGNLTSQLFANIYLHELDWYVKMELREPYYLRYCDDFVILGKEREALLRLSRKINGFLGHVLSLSLHPQKLFIRTWGQGIDFLGYVLLPNAMVVRTKTATRMLRRADTRNLPSYLGVCRHADAYRLEQVMRTRTADLSAV